MSDDNSTLDDKCDQCGEPISSYWKGLCPACRDEDDDD